MINIVRNERLRRDLTQQDLANQVGVSRQTINSIEAARYVPSTVLALKLAAVFEMSVNELFELEEED